MNTEECNNLHPTYSWYHSPRLRAFLPGWESRRPGMWSRGPGQYACHRSSPDCPTDTAINIGQHDHIQMIIHYIVLLQKTIAHPKHFLLRSAKKLTLFLIIVKILSSSFLT